MARYPMKAAHNIIELPLVAIITPVYNGEKYLSRAFECVQAQVYENIIHIVLDNASTDRTPDIIEEYANLHSNILTSKNSSLIPLTANWDKAFSLIPKNARYAKLLCADDIMRSDCVSKFVALAESDQSVEVVSCHDVHGDLIRRANIPDGINIITGNVAAASILDRSICWLPFQHLFVRLHSEDFEQPFFGTNEYGADPYAVVRSAIRGKFGYVHEALVYTRWHDESASNNLSRDITSPLYAMQINLMLMTYFKMILKFGRSVWKEEDYLREVRFSRATIARTILRWKIAGFRKAAGELHLSMKTVGNELNLTDYTRSILNIPSYILWKRRWRTRIGPSLHEKDFL